jgi:Tfp pilus assembly protein PilX
MNKHSHHQSEGFALILALLVASVALAIGLSLLDITVKQLTLNTTVQESEVAFQAAAAGMNCLQFARNQEPIESQIDGGNFNVPCLQTSLSLDATAAARVFNAPYNEPAKTCTMGDVCTYAYSRGYNRSCADIAAGSIFAVQRELTAEF